MGSLRAGLSSFWTSVLELLDTDDVTNDSLYKQGINRLSDRTAWLRDEISRRTTALARTTLGTTAKITGSVDLSTLVYDDIAGDLNSGDIQVQSDSSALFTVTFGTGAGLAPTGPADVVTQINNATGGNPLASIDSAGHLTLASVTSGAGGTVTANEGTFFTLSQLGFSGGATATGTSSGGDGISIVGGAGIVGSNFTIFSGTVRSMLQQVADGAASSVALARQIAASGDTLIGMAAIAGSSFTIPIGTLRAGLTYIANNAAKTTANTFTGAQTRQGTAAVDVERVTQVASSTTTYTFATANDTIFVDMQDGASPAALQVWTATSTGAVLNATVNVAVYDSSGSSHHVDVKRDDASTICSLANYGFATLKFIADPGHTTGRWRVVSMSGTGSTPTPF